MHDPKGYGIALDERIRVAKKIVDHAGNKRYNLIGDRLGSEFESFTMNYRYLTWWLGNEPTKKRKGLYFIIRKSESGIKLIKREEGKTQKLDI